MKKLTCTFISTTFVIALTAALVLHAQAPQEQSGAAAPPPMAPALRVSTHLVLLDVIATDKTGKPVTDLKKEDFKVEESGHGQTITSFSFEQPAEALERPQAPEGIFTNRPAYHLPDRNATILLIDGLNSPFANQAYARTQLMKYAASQVAPDRPLAVYSLGNKLYEIQSFTTDPTLIQKAIENFRPQQPMGSTGLAPSHGSAAAVAGALDASASRGQAGGVAGSVSSAGSTSVALQQFTSELTVSDLQFRIDHTLDAMRELAQMVAGQQGRKNLVWVTAGLPFSLIPSDNSVSVANVGMQDPTTMAGTAAPLPVNPNGSDSYIFANSDIRQQAADRVKRVAALLAGEQVAIYPVDVRGVIGSIATDASSSGTDASGFLVTDKAFGATVTGVNASIEASQSNMEDLAKQTGGKLYKNRNDIDKAVNEASNDGATYYELGYVPDKTKFDGGFRKIKVSVTRPGVQLRYRPGYFAVDQSKENEKDRKNDLVLALSSPSDSSMVIFDAQVTPAAGAKEVPIKILIRPDTISVEETKDKKQIDVDYYAVVVDPAGKQMSMQGKTAKAGLDADQYASMMKQGLLLSLNVPAPPPGHYDFRLAVRDNKTGYIGTIHAPVDVGK